MAGYDFDAKFPTALGPGNRRIAGAVIFQKDEHDKDVPITLSGNMVRNSSGLWVPVSDDDPLPVKGEMQLTGSIVKRTSFASKYTFLPSEEWVLCEDYELGENTIRWGLFFKEHARPLHEVLENLAVNVSVYTQPGTFGRINGLFERTMYPTLEDSPLHPLAIPGYDDQQSIINNIILYNKPFTYNLGRYLRISLINKSNASMAIARAMLVEEGYQ